MPAIGKVIRTARYLKPVQVVYQVRNRLIKSRKLSFFEKDLGQASNLIFFPLLNTPVVLKINETHRQFEFLNLSQIYQKRVDWNDQKHGRLWNYNLQYLDFLRQKNISTKEKTGLLLDLYQELWSGNLPLEPYPASLRIMNVIRFLSTETNVEDKEVLIRFLSAEVNYLSKNLEYHLLGNHLLENAFALLMGGFFFKNSLLIARAERLLSNELDEQILNDGAHFELSPMYHQILFFRVLEALNYTKNRSAIHELLMSKAKDMAGWLASISFSDGSIPHFNDSTDGIAPSIGYLHEMAGKLGLVVSPIKLRDSGYRKFAFNGIEMVMDVHGISPSYQPGHAHADTFSFLLSYQNQPIIVDPGISTYAIGDRRSWERSTNAHNTVEVNSKSSSEVWAGFRVGKRANVVLVEDNPSFINAFHDGYRKEGLRVSRRFYKNDEGIQIEDELLGFNPTHSAMSYLHFHPEVNMSMEGANSIQIIGGISIKIEGEIFSEMESYHFCNGYNKTTEAKRLKIRLMGGNCKIRIKIH